MGHSNNYTFRKWRSKILAGLLGSGLVFLFTIMVFARSTGITGRTSSSGGGCTCHDPSSSSNTSLSASISGGSWTVDPSTSYDITITVSNSGQIKAGINLAVKTTETGSTDAGTLSAGTGLQVSNGEITHTSPHDLSGGSADFNFSWTSPSEPGEYYLRAAGNAVDNSGDNSGDQWNFLTPQVITVAGVTVSAPASGNTYCTGNSLDVEWTSYGIETVKIELSSDGGSNYSDIATGVNASAGEYSWNIPSDQAGGTQYRLRVTDESNQERSDAMDGNFSISGPAAITSHPSGATVCTGEQIELSVEASGLGLSYQWKKDGNNIAGATNATYTKTAESGDGGNYTVVVNNDCGDAVESNAAEITINVTPDITTAPQDQSVCAGDNVQFTVEAEGTNISYQWRKDGEDLTGETGTTLSLSNVTEADSGDYTVVVSGICDPSAQATAELVILKSPAIVTQPQAKETCEGEEVTFIVEAEGAVLNYQWYKENTEIQGATSAELVITETAPEDAGSYRVEISGTCDPAVTSDAVDLTVNPLPDITMQPQGATILEGESATFTVKADDAASYQWQKDGNDIQGETSASLVLENAVLADAGDYVCVVSNDCGNAESDAAALQVQEAGPGPRLTLNITGIDFGLLALNTTKDTTITGLITNSGDQPLQINGVSIEGDHPSEFEIEQFASLPVSIDPDQSVNMTISFKPVSAGEKSAAVTFDSNADSEPQLNLRGTAGSIIVSSSMDVVDFGQVDANSSHTMSIDIMNVGNLPALLINPQISGENSTEFDLLTDLNNYALLVGETIAAEIEFTPGSEGSYSAELTLDVENSDGLSIQLTGTARATSVSQIEDIFNEFRAYPNPTEGKMRFKFSLKEAASADFRIIDALGNSIKSFDNNFTFGRENELTWDGRTDSGEYASSGTYFLIIDVGGRRTTVPFVITN